MRKLTLTGNVGADAVIRTNSSTGKQFATFSIATTIKDKPYWTKITCSEKFINVAQYLKTGCKVLIEGIPSANTYTSKNGEVVAELVCHATIIELIAKPPVQEEPNANMEISPEDISF